MNPIKVLCIAGARPNFIKIAPLMRALAAHPACAPLLIHTGQHYDDRLSQVFFEELGIPRPSRNLDVGSGSHAVQTADVMRRFEGVLHEEQPEVVLVVGEDQQMQSFHGGDHSFPGRRAAAGRIKAGATHSLGWTSGPLAPTLLGALWGRDQACRDGGRRDACTPPRTTSSSASTSTTTISRAFMFATM